MKELLNKIRWFSQGALRIDADGYIIYTDPFDIDKIYNDADVILITHLHTDHLSYENIDKVIKKDTLFVIPMSCSDALDAYPQHQIAEIMPFDVFNLDHDISLEAVPAYNIVKTQFHPFEKEWVGYILTINDTVLYYTSDTELIPEMQDIVADIIFVPLGQTYTMQSVEDAALAVLFTKAKIAVPIHYGKFEGSTDDAKKFAELLDGKAEVIILK